MMEIETIMFDLDGTVLTPLNQVPEELPVYLNTLKERGKRIFAVTGRSLSEAKEVLPEHFPVEGMVTANGMAVFAGKEKIFQSALDAALVHQLIERASEKQLFYEMHRISGGRIAFAKDKAYMEAQISGEKPERVHINEWLSRQEVMRHTMTWLDSLPEESWKEIVKIYFYSSSVDQMQAWKKELAERNETIPFDFFSSSHNNVEVNTKGISKASGIRILLDHFKLNVENALVLGDGENDLPMFHLAGHSAAMKNAPEAIQAQADEVTEFSCSENGVYHHLKKIFG